MIESNVVTQQLVFDVVYEEGGPLAHIQAAVAERCGTRDDDGVQRHLADLVFSRKSSVIAGCYVLFIDPEKVRTAVTEEKILACLWAGSLNYEGLRAALAEMAGVPEIAVDLVRVERAARGLVRAGRVEEADGFLWVRRAAWGVGGAKR